MSVVEVGGEGIARSMLEWSNAEVVRWLATLSLSQDYSEKFRGERAKSPGETFPHLAC